MAYRQRDYPDVAYPSRAYPDATVATSGCGPTCVSILLGNLLGVELPPPEAAAYALRCGARVDGGTDMGLLSANLMRDYGLTRVRTDSAEELLRALKAGHMAIVNVGGDRAGRAGVLSAGGHYLVAVGAFERTVLLLDPGIYPGKYAGQYRGSRVGLCGELVCVDRDVLAGDCQNRSPAYTIFGRRDGTPPVA